MMRLSDEAVETLGNFQASKTLFDNQEVLARVLEAVTRALKAVARALKAVARIQNPSVKVEYSSY
jgi:hypothetical protein